MQVVKNEEKAKQCQCSVEQRFASLGAKIDRMLARMEAKQHDVHERTSNVMHDVGSALKKLRDELTEIRGIVADAGSKVAKDLGTKKQEDVPTISAAQDDVPCTKPRCPRHEADLEDLAPSDQDQPLW